MDKKRYDTDELKVEIEQKCPLQVFKEQTNKSKQTIALTMQFLNPYLAIYALVLCFAPIIRTVSVLKQRRCTGQQRAYQKTLSKDFWMGLDFLYNILFKKPDENYLESTHNAFAKLGSTYSVKRLIWTTISTRDSKNIKHVLAEDFKRFQLPGIRVSAMEPLLGSGIFSLNGKSWSHARSMLKPCFAKKDKEAIIGTLESHFQSLLKRVQRCKEVDLQPLFFCLAMDFATEFLTGKSTRMLDNATSNSDAEQFVKDYMVCSEEVVARMSLGPLQHFRISPSAWFAKKRIFRYVDKFIEEAQSSNEAAGVTTGNFLADLSAATTDRKVLRDQMLHILVASRDTIASLLSNLFFVLAKKPDVYEKLREEVLAHVGNEPPSSQDLKQMEYLKWCIQECKQCRKLHLPQ